MQPLLPLWGIILDFGADSAISQFVLGACGLQHKSVHHSLAYAAPPRMPSQLSEGRQGPSRHWVLARCQDSSAGEGRRERAYPEWLLGWVWRFCFLLLSWVCMHSPRDLHQAPKPPGHLSPQPAHIEDCGPGSLSPEHVPEGAESPVPSRTLWCPCRRSGMTGNDQIFSPLWTASQVMNWEIK